MGDAPRDGKHCPACGQDIGLWPVFSAGLPSRIRCPHCKARLAYAGAWPVFFGMLAVALPLFVSIALLSRELAGRRWAPVFLVVALAAWCPIELVVARWLRERRVLEKRA